MPVFSEAPKTFSVLFFLILLERITFFKNKYLFGGGGEGVQTRLFHSTKCLDGAIVYSELIGWENKFIHKNLNEKQSRTKKRSLRCDWFFTWTNCYVSQQNRIKKKVNEDQKGNRCQCSQWLQQVIHFPFNYEKKLSPIAKKTFDRFLSRKIVSKISKEIHPVLLVKVRLISITKINIKKNQRARIICP